MIVKMRVIIILGLDDLCTRIFSSTFWQNVHRGNEGPECTFLGGCIAIGDLAGMELCRGLVSFSPLMERRKTCTAKLITTNHCLYWSAGGTFMVRRRWSSRATVMEPQSLLTSSLPSNHAMWMSSDCKDIVMREWTLRQIKVYACLPTCGKWLMEYGIW